ncbi:related to zeta-crystallin / quinone reductase (NADPH) [Rhynchosporium graminicola]|uniref:Related to zeta-crystallin / quinone reductase (NADPH) n=1 Tax=Rhynchosporium graminicola TaxID=2792576 RepID=A0A1E1KER5_9HELO|nr:related to zeta-crystallin / quinone reductase (NADPH) [Rhynchosporium commune]
MLEVIVHPLPELTTEIVDSSIPTPGPDELLVKVEVAASNVKDWLHPTTRNISLNSGDDMAGTVCALGGNVESNGEFQVGHRVAAFHPMFTSGGTYAEYAVAPRHTVFKIPDRMSFEEAATIPLVVTTAALSLFKIQGLPTPWSFPSSPTTNTTPLIIYGASSSLGTFALKLALASNIHPILAIAGSSSSHILPLLDLTKGDCLIDYRSGISAMQHAIRTFLAERDLEARHAIDAISANGSWITISQLLAPGGQLSVVSGVNAYDEPEMPEGVEVKYTFVGAVHEGLYKKGMPKQPARELVEGMPAFAGELFEWLGGDEGALAREVVKGHPFEVVSGGLDGVETGLRMLKSGNAGGKKFIYRVSETVRLAK